MKKREKKGENVNVYKRVAKDGIQQRGGPAGAGRADGRFEKPDRRARPRAAKQSMPIGGRPQTEGETAAFV